MTVHKRIGNIIDTSLAFGSITASYTTLVDLTDATTYLNLSMNSTLDQDVTIKFVNSEGKEYLLEAGYDQALDDDSFQHDGVIQVKHNGVAPTVGRLKFSSW